MLIQLQIIKFKVLCGFLVRVKVKPVLLQARTGLIAQGGRGFKFYRQSAHEDGKYVSRQHRLLLPTRRCLWYSFLLEAESNLGPQGGRKD
jgi:hypothetical protein